MKKNGEFVGVDEKYIPENEKYVDNTLNDEIKGTIRDGVKSAKDYISKDENKEKIKKGAKKGLKIAKNVGCGYLIFIGFIFLFVIGVFIFIFANTFKTQKQVNKSINDVTEKVINGEKVITSDDDTNDDVLNKIEISNFNSSFEFYNGNQYGLSVLSLLDEVNLSNKKDDRHIITVVCDNITATENEQIVSVKKIIDKMRNYEVSLEYDGDGFVNKIIISEA